MNCEPCDYSAPSSLISTEKNELGGYENKQEDLDASELLKYARMLFLCKPICILQEKTNMVQILLSAMGIRVAGKYCEKAEERINLEYKP